MTHTLHTPAGTVVGTTTAGPGATVQTFLGIPYAEAPVGERRFAAPVRRGRFDEPWQALAYGPTPQRVPLFVTTTVPEPSIPGEDTLNLNVFAPLGEAGCPVLVWIHGGGYIAGSAASSWYDGTTLAREGVVVVSISYRLGVDGFAAMDGVPTNLGVRDMLAALGWVQDNVAAFGGDPSRVTVAGQSAGGGAVLTLLASPLGDGLFSAAMSISGVDWTVPAEQAAAATAALAGRLGVPPTRDGFAAVDDRTAQRALVQATDTDSGDLSLRLAPLHGDDVVPDALPGGLRRSRTVPLLIGSTADEFDGGPTGESPHRPPIDAAQRAAGRAAGSRVTDTLFRAVCPRTAAVRAGGPTWLYSFEWASPVTQGATHCIDIPFFLGTLDRAGIPEALGPNPPAVLGAAMHADLLRFVRGHDAAWACATGVHGDVARVYGADGDGGNGAADGPAGAATSPDGGGVADVAGPYDAVVGRPVP